MSDFLVIIDDVVTNIISVETSSMSAQLLEQGSFDIQTNEETSILNVEASFIDSVNNIEIQRYNDYNLTLSNSIYGQLPDSIPMDIITGNLNVNRIDGLEYYLDHYEFDCGTP